MRLYIIAAAGAIISLGLTGCGNSQSGGNTSQAQQASQLLQMMGPPLADLPSQPALADSFACGNKGVEICHLPPGNQANKQDLCIGAPAIDHHLKEHHRGELGDYLGPCVSSSDTGGTSTGSTGGTDSSGSTGGTDSSSGGLVDCTAPGANLIPTCQ